MTDTVEIYLAHSSHEQVQGKELEKRLTELDPNIRVHNPFDKENPAYEELHSIIKGKDGFKLSDEEIGEQMTDEFAAWIVDVDLEAIRKSDIVIVIFPQPEYHSIGAVCEMFYASRTLNMPVLVYAPKHLINHPWIIDHSDVLCDNIDDLFQFLGWYLEQDEP